MSEITSNSVKSNFVCSSESFAMVLNLNLEEGNTYSQSPLNGKSPFKIPYTRCFKDGVLIAQGQARVRKLFRNQVGIEGKWSNLYPK